MSIISIGPTQAERELIRIGQEKFAIDFPGQDFDHYKWRVDHLNTRSTRKTNANIYFTRTGMEDTPLPPRFADVLKACLVRYRKGKSNLVMRVDAGRILWEAILQRLGPDNEAHFQWLDITEADLQAAERLMLRRWAETTTHKTAQQLGVIVDLLTERGIMRDLHWTVLTPRPEDRNRLTIDGQEEQAAKLVSKEALRGIIGIFEDPKNDKDLLIAAALVIMLATGLRVGEALTLPYRCLEQEESERGDLNWCLKYYKEKSANQQKMLETKWLTKKQAEIAENAIAVVDSLTADARRRAKLLELSPDTVPVPGHNWTDETTSREIEHLLGLKRGSANAIPSAKLPRRTTGRGGGAITYFRTADVAAYLQSLRGNGWTIRDKGDGEPQLLSDSLFVVFKNFFHTTRGMNPLIVEAVTDQPLSDFLTGREFTDKRGEKERYTKIASAFERYEIREKDGTIARMTSHDVRHWLNDGAHKGGASLDVLTLWNRREHRGDAEAYLHMTMDERIAWLMEKIRSREVAGPVVDRYFMIVEDERDAYLEGLVQAVHFTPFGICSHDFALEPCPYHLNCIKGKDGKGCREFCHDPNNPKQVQRLVQLENRTKKALEAAEKAVADGNTLAENWVDDHKSTLIGIKSIREAKQDADSSGWVRPFAGAASKYTPLEN